MAGFRQKDPASGCDSDEPDCQHRGCSPGVTVGMPCEVECDDKRSELGEADQTQIERRSMGAVLLQAEFVAPPEFGNLDRALLQPFPRLVFGGANFFAGQFLGENCQQRLGALIASGSGYPKPMISLSEIDACAAPL